MPNPIHIREATRIDGDRDGRMVNMLNAMRQVIMALTARGKPTAAVVLADLSDPTSDAYKAIRKIIDQ